MNLIKKLSVCLVLITGFLFSMEEDKSDDNLGAELIKAVSGYTPLAKVWKKVGFKDQNLETLKLLIKNCIARKSFRASEAKCYDLDLQDEMGNTPLILATQAGQIELVSLLINAYCDLNINNVLGMTALLQASFYGKLDIVKLLVLNIADIDFRNPNDGFTALMYAHLNEHMDIVYFLIKNGSKLNEQDKMCLLKKKKPARLREGSSACNLI